LPAEIDAAFPLGTLPDYESLKYVNSVTSAQLPYLQSVINETLRLYPPVPIDAKDCLADDVWPDGVKVPGGITIVWHAYAMGRYFEYWDQPDEFRPERWCENANGGKPMPVGNQPPFIPFQYGPRTCLGIHMAYLEVKVAMVLILQKFRFSLEKGHRVHKELSLTMFAKYGMRMHVLPRAH